MLITKYDVDDRRSQYYGNTNSITCIHDECFDQGSQLPSSSIKAKIGMWHYSFHSSRYHDAMEETSRLNAQTVTQATAT